VRVISIKMRLIEIKSEAMDWILLSQNRYKQWDLFNAVMASRVVQMAENSLE
jgi:hypothetical protein